MENNRRSFLKKSAIAGIGLGTYPSLSGAAKVTSTGTGAAYDLSSSPLPAPFQLTGLQSRAVTKENPCPLFQDHLDELKTLMDLGVGKKGYFKNPLF